MVWGKAGSDTLTSAGDDMDITSMTASKFNTALMHIFSSGSTGHRKRYGSGSIDTGSNYAERSSANGGTDVTYTSQDRNTGDNQSSGDRFQIEYGINIATEEKLFIYFDVNATTTGAGTAPNREEYTSKWTNTSNQYDQRRSYNALSGSCNTDSNVTALGSDITPVAAIPFPTDVQVGSRAEITDTRKMYYKFDANAYHSAGWYEAGTVPYAGGRGVFGGGTTNSNVMDYIMIDTTGNATDFGDLTVGRSSLAGGGRSTTRGIFAGGESSTTNTMDYITIATTGNATDFGDLTVTRRGMGGVSSDTRFVVGGGYTGALSNVMDYVTIDTTGNATDFGDLTEANYSNNGVFNNTRGVFGGGANGLGAYRNTIEYITINTTGNATDFGDLTSVTGAPAGGLNNSTRGIFAGGYTGSHSNKIDYITISTTGNASDFGDLTTGRSGCAGVSTATRGVIGGGQSNSNVMDYITIDSTGNATDFGDLTVGRNSLAGCFDYVP